MNKKTVTRVIAIVLAILMMGSVMLAAIQAFALNPNMLAIVNTGDTNTNHTMIIVAVVAVVVVGVCVVLPVVLKKRK